MSQTKLAGRDRYYADPTMEPDPQSQDLYRRVRAAAQAAGRRLPEPAARVLRPAARKVAGFWQPGAAGAAGSRRPEGTRPELPIPPLRHIPEVATIEPPPLPEGRERLTVWPDTPPPGYLGQLEPEGQKRLAERWAGVRLEDCFFYHRSALPDGRVIEGPWNLIGGESEYLGGIDLDGRRVLELGPASGWLTVWMEQRGAHVVGFDLGWDAQPDLLPLPGLDLDRMRADHIRTVSHVQNAWWFLQHAYGLTAEAVYGSIYDLPADIGRYGVSVFGSILLHLRDPFQALYQAAQRTDEAIVVVEPLRHGPLEAYQPIVNFNITRGGSPNGWWGLSPGAVVDMLGVLGFPAATLSFHRQPYRPENNPVEGATSVINYTVVARR